MENINLYNLWQAAEFNDGFIAKNSISARLPTHILARVSAISKLFPNKTRTEILIDLLKAGLGEFEKSLPKPTMQQLTAEESKAARDLGEFPENYVPPHGPKVDYYNYANQHYIELEKERGNKDAKDIFKIKY